MVLNFNFKGRGCLAVTNCPLKQRVHKVTWMPNTQSVLAAAEDGKCYLWDTRDVGGLEKGIFTGGKSFNKMSAAYSVKVSPFNHNLFASSHKNGTVNVWDIRYETVPFLTITAHKSSINCIDWHPAIPNVMASCGYRDITIKIWNLSDDDLAQRKYYDYWNKMSHHRNYNNEDDYRQCIEEWNHYQNRQQPISKLTPNCSMYPSGHVTQIGWRPCRIRSLSNQIACSYVGGEPVVDMWDIKSSYVPVASLSSHKLETKFKFMLRDRPFRDMPPAATLSSPALHKSGYELEQERVRMRADSMEYRKDRFIGDARTYLITCSKDKSVKLTDCGFADIPRSHLSSCALDIAPFGDTVLYHTGKVHPTIAKHHDFENLENF